MKLFSKIILPVLCCCIVFEKCAISQTYNFRNYSAEDGLAFVQVSAIYQDSKGFLWSGGYGGLSRFDGISFINYGLKDGLNNNFVTSITEDRSGNLWVGTVVGLSKLTNGKFTNYLVEDGLSGNHINALLTDMDGVVWIASNKGLSVFRNEKFENYTSKNGLEGDNVLSIFQDSKKKIWVGTETGLSKLANDTFKKISPRNESMPYSANAICEDKNGNLWIGTNNGAYTYNDNESTFFIYPTTGELTSEKITSIEADKNGAVFIGTYKGLYCFENNKLKHLNVRHEDRSNHINCMYNDFENNLWLGSFSGLYRYHGAAFLTYNEFDGLANTFIFQMLRDKNNTMWICSGNGLYKYDGKEFKVLTTKDGLVNNELFSIIMDKEEAMWIATTNGISKYDGKKFTNYQKKDGLIGNAFYAVFEDAAGNIWFGGEGGVTKYDRKKFTNYTLGNTEAGEMVAGILQDRNGNLWFAVYQGGLYKYDGKNFTDVSKQLQLTSKSYNSIIEDKEGVLYMGTFDGVFMYDGKTVTQFSEKDGMNSDLIWLMTFNNNENELWIGTNQGLNKLDIAAFKKTGKKIIEPYGKEEGFLGIECNTNGLFHDTDSSLWFGTVNGLIKYSQKAFVPNDQESKTNITSIRLADQDTLLINQSTIPYDLNTISFNYSGISFTNPLKVKYSYLLEGLDKEWSVPSKYTFTNYSSLPSGKYTFRVKSCNNKGVWNTHPSEFTFTIAKPYWEKWWFWTINAVICCGLLIALFRYRLQQIKIKEQAHLHQKIKLSTNELKALRAQMNPHFIFNALNSIQNFIISRDETAASKYLNKFAKLIRTILNSSEKPTATLKEELDALMLYIDMEVMRFEDMFNYSIVVDPAIDTEYYEIPTLLLQPYVENAILHGLVPKNKKGKLQIKISLDGSRLVCCIEDDGIGRKRSIAIKERQGRKYHQSMAMKITKDRLDLINSTSNSNLSVKIIDLEDSTAGSSGTKVEIFIPID